MNKKILFLMLFFMSVISFPAIAVDTSPMTAPNLKTDCSQGSSNDQAQCIHNKLTALESNMNDALTKEKAMIKSDWGKDADTEITNRMDQAQSAWIKYRDAQCMQGFYNQAPSIPPSQGLQIVSCKYDKTLARLSEIKSIN
jgi:uncharacterized protein YecT (DUF1311 family)